MVDGNKTLIGISILYLDQRFQFGNEWYVEILRVLVYLWTGFGTIDKGLKHAENKGYVSKIPLLRKPNDKFRNWRR